jgi:hypothetical protein
VVTKFIISFGVRFGVFAVGRLVEAGGGGYSWYSGLLSIGRLKRFYTHNYCKAKAKTNP